MYKFIHDLDELKKFYDIVLPPLTDEEVFFLSLSCRQKWMKDLNITAVRKGSSEMFDRKIIGKKDIIMFLRTIRKYEANDGAYTFDNGDPMPIEGMAIYWNINPSNMVRATSEFGQKFIQSLAEVALGQGSSLEYIKHMDREILSCLHRSQGTKHYLDIDVDMRKNTKFSVKGNLVIDNLLNILVEKGVKFFLVDHISGYHILMKKDTVKFDYTSWLRTMLDADKCDENGVFEDLMTNHNRMLILPGTMGGGYPIKILWGKSNL